MSYSPGAMNSMLACPIAFIRICQRWDPEARPCRHRIVVRRRVAVVVAPLGCVQERVGVGVSEGEEGEEGEEEEGGDADAGVRAGEGE
jgi:hypothetical protein